MTQRNRLAPCPGCQRHVRVSEVACPFCGAAIVLVARPVPVSRQKLGRAAIFAFGSAIATAAPGCYLVHERGEPIERRPVVDAWHDDEDAGGSIGLLYGTPPDLDRDAAVVVDAAEDVDAAIDEGAPITLYGGPFPIDPIDAGPADDAGASNNALYGGPPEEGGGSEV